MSWLPPTGIKLADQGRKISDDGAAGWPGIRQNREPGVGQGGAEWDTEVFCVPYASPFYFIVDYEAPGTNETFDFQGVRQCRLQDSNL
jgi:hypothetical protein